MSIVPQRPLDFGEVIDAAFQLYRRDFFDYTIIAVVALAPSYAFLGIGELALATRFPGAEFDPATLAQEASALLGAMGWVAAGFLVSVFAWTALVAGVSARAADRRPAFAPSCREALRRTPAMLGAVALIGIVVTAGAGAIFVGSVLIGGVATVAGVNSAVAFAAAMAATFALMGLVACWFASSAFAVVPAAVVERAGPWEAVRRSFRLARKARLRIFGVLLVATIMLTLPSVALEAFAYAVSGLVAAEPGGAVSAGRYWMIQVGHLTLGSVTTPLFAACVMMLYYDQRVRLEAYDLETAASALGADS